MYNIGFSCSRKALFYAFLSVMFIFSPGLNAKSATYPLHTAKSKLVWEGKKITGSHQGTIQIQKGKITKKGNSFSGLVIIDMNSIVCTDLKNKTYNQKLVRHLKSEDFFHTQKYKSSKLEIIRAKKTGKKDYMVQAKITIRGITRKIQFPAKAEFGSKTFQAQGRIKLDRTRFNIKYKSGKFFKSLGDKLIYDDFTLNFSIFSK